MWVDDRDEICICKWSVFLMLLHSISVMKAAVVSCGDIIWYDGDMGEKRERWGSAPFSLSIRALRLQYCQYHAD